jgi:hypothetical protein
MPLSLALKTATLASHLPVVKPANLPPDQQSSTMRRRIFGSRIKPTTSPSTYELAGRSTFALVHGAILRYHSAFGDDQNGNATPDNTHFLNATSIVCVTDMIPGFKWVLEIKTKSKGHGIRSPMKKSKNSKSLVDRRVDLSKLPWEVVDGLQAWYLVFEGANLMAEWMTLLRGAVADIKEREIKADKSPAKTPKSKGSAKSPAKAKSPTQIDSPTSTVTESLPSTSPSSSRRSFLRGSVEGSFSNRNSLVEPRNSISEVQSTSGRSNSSVPEEGTAIPRVRQPSQQDIALTAFRISAFEEDLASFIPPTLTEQQSSSTPELHISTISLNSTSEQCHSAPSLTPNLSHYSHKRASIISLQSRLSSHSSGLRTPYTAISPTSSPTPKPRRTLRRTISGESAKTNTSWKLLQSLPPPHPPPTGPLPIPPQSNYVAKGLNEGLFSRDVVMGVSPVLERDTPREVVRRTPRSSPYVGSPPENDVLGSINMLTGSVKTANS